MTGLRLAHFSDLHLACEPPAQAALAWCSKRSLSRLAWARGRRELQRPEVLAAAVADARAHSPAHWLITGDVVNFSLPIEFVQAAAWFTALDAPERVSVIPGNHDALVPVPEAEGWGLWRTWMRGDGGEESFPYRRTLADGVVLIGLSTALPTPPGFASGELGELQLRRFETLLAESRGAFRIVALHHPPADGVVRARKALRDRAAFRAVLARHGAELVLHGHSRDARFDPLRGPHGLIASLGLPSISAIPNPKDEGARWTLFDLAPTSGGWALTTTVRRYDPATQGFAAAGSYRLLIAAP